MKKLILLLLIVLIIAGCNNVKTKNQKQVTKVKPDNLTIQIAPMQKPIAYSWFTKVLQKKQYILTGETLLNKYKNYINNSIYAKVGTPPQPANQYNDKWREWIGKYTKQLKLILKSNSVAYSVFNKTGVVYDYSICVEDMNTIPNKEPTSITPTRKQAILSTIKRCVLITNQLKKFIGE